MSEAICGEKTERELDLLMVGYRRNFVPGGTYFFTVTLADRRLSMLVDHIDVLRSALRTARSERPFTIDAIVILPDHLHAILTLPPEDSDFSGRWRRIKGYFSSGLIDASIELVRRPNGSLALWQSRFLGGILARAEEILENGNNGCSGPKPGSDPGYRFVIRATGRRIISSRGCHIANHP
jgi:REP element-mobilizing transposase RayT